MHFLMSSTGLTSSNLNDKVIEIQFGMCPLVEGYLTMNLTPCSVLRAMSVFRAPWWEILTKHSQAQCQSSMGVIPLLFH